MSFAWGAVDAGLRGLAIDLLEARFAASGIKTRYYAPDVHLAAFALPPYVRQLVAG